MIYVKKPILLNVSLMSSIKKMFQAGVTAPLFSKKPVTKCNYPFVRTVSIKFKL